MYSLRSQFLSEHSLQNVLLPRLVISDGNQDPCCDIAGYGAAENDGR